MVVYRNLPSLFSLRMTWCQFILCLWRTEQFRLPLPHRAQYLLHEIYCKKDFIFFLFNYVIIIYIFITDNTICENIFNWQQWDNEDKVYLYNNNINIYFLTTLRRMQYSLSCKRHLEFHFLLIELLHHLTNFTIPYPVQRQSTRFSCVYLWINFKAHR